MQSSVTMLEKREVMSTMYNALLNWSAFLSAFLSVFEKKSFCALHNGVWGGEEGRSHYMQSSFSTWCAKQVPRFITGNWEKNLFGWHYFPLHLWRLLSDWLKSLSSDFCSELLDTEVNAAWLCWAVVTCSVSCSREYWLLPTILCLVF